MLPAFPFVTLGYLLGKYSKFILISLVYQLVCDSVQDRMSKPTPTTIPPSSYTAVPTISNATYYISAQSFGVVVEFASASGNLTRSNFTGDTSQQVFGPHSYWLRPRKADVLIAIAESGR